MLCFARKENILHHKIRWLYKQKIQQKLQEIPESTNIISEWGNIKTTFSQVTDESLGKHKAFTQKKKLKIWDDEIKLIVQQTH